MAKKQIKNYVFSPGIGATEYVYPDAYSLLLANRSFLISESVAYINQEIIDAVKCQRDIGYIIDGIAWDVALGTNYNSIFLGLAEVNSLDLSNTVVRTIARTKTAVAALTAVLGNATALSRTNTAFDEVLDIVQNGRSAASSHSYTNPTDATTSRIAAKDKIIANLDFLAAEVNAWVNVTYPMHDHDVDKCTRDTKYALYAAAYDILYGGNSASYDSAKFFYYFASSGLSGISAEHKAQTVAAYRHLQSIISNVVQGIAITASVGNAQAQVISGSNADLSDGTAVANLIDIVADVVDGGEIALPGSRTTPSITWAVSGIQAAKSAIDAAAPAIIEAVTWDPDYTYNQSKCERDLGFVLDAYLHDLRYGGNQKLKSVIKYYWEGSVAQIDGTRVPEIDTHAFIGELITDYIFTNTAYDTQGLVSQVIDTTDAELPAIAVIETLVSNVVDVITNGLTSMPASIPQGVGSIKFQGQYSSNELLLITNTTRNEIIYNFSSNSTGGRVEIQTRGSDTDFVKYLQTTDGITTVTFNYNTSSHSETDDIQIFVEEAEVRTRPYDFGTDAIERNRMAQPQSMLDADFEYGLQPTKWSAISTLRGYPSVYEIPGTDTDVISVITDASSGTSGIGQSRITVTTVSPHGFTAGTPISIKALENSITGAARAEGNFVITTVPTTTTFTYFAKAKVGTTDGQVLSTNYTQLRQAGFYTGANIGKPTFVVSSNGSSGTLTTVLDTPIASSIIAFSGDLPEIGSPLTNVNIPLGSQVTAINGEGGVFLTKPVAETAIIGSTSVQLENASGVIPNLAVDRGDGIAMFVTSIVGNILNFSDEFTSPVIANSAVYTNVAGTNDVSSGFGATFDVTVSLSNEYEITVDTPGSGFKVGDRLIISGSNLGGASPRHDLLIIVSTVDTLGEILTVTGTGTPFTGTEIITGVTGTNLGGIGTLGTFDVSWTDNVYTSVTVSGSGGSGYTVGDRIKVLGSLVYPSGGADVVNDLYITVDTVDGTGQILTASGAGTAPNAIKSFNTVAYSTSGLGTGAVVNVGVTGATYNVTISPGGIDFQETDTITVLGAAIGGATPANNLVITVNGIDPLTGEILSFNWSGTANNSATATGVAGDILVGTGAVFEVELDAGTYSVVVSNGGSNYGPGQQILVSGNNIIGDSPTNDLTITVSTTNGVATGVVTAISTSGTAATPSGPYLAVFGVDQQNIGVNARFNITRSASAYSGITSSVAGTGYQVGNRIVIPGTLLEGTSPTNDVLINVTNVSESGGITSFTPVSSAASSGTALELISTVSMTEATSGLILNGSSVTFSAIATIEINFSNPHGLVPGDTFIVTVSSDDGSNNHLLASGSYFATEIPSISSLRYQARAVGAINTTSTTILGTVYPRPDSFFTHRPFDGGVQLGTGGPQHGAQAIRQSKKYIRYQSGKGIMYTTGALFAPSYDLRSVTSDGIEVNSIITVVTDDNDHGVQVGGVIRLLGVETEGYNSGFDVASPPEFDYTVIDVVDERTFRIRAQRRLGSTDAVLGFGAQMSVVSWHGATVRSGIFDDQNGIFWEYDGTNISVNQRTGTKQLAGTGAILVDDNLVTGTNTKFRDQVKAGDRVVIKGMTHVVSNVINQTSMTVTPDFRGVTSATGTKIMLVVDKKVKQEDFNLDRLDGTGPSGYKIDIAKMQMIGIQYSWYGAGFIDFMLRGADGNFVFCHRMRNSNVNTEAFMRSGNLPVRYEVTNEGPPGKLSAAMTDTQTFIDLEDGSFFPDSGTVYIDNEIITFTSRSGNRLLGCIRSAPFTTFQAGADRTYTAGIAASHADNTGVILISNTITPLISHWGSAFLTDGGFDEDRGYIFSYAETNLSISTTKQTAFMIRLAPSVSNAIIGDLGERELLNRAQLLLQGLEITSDNPTTAQNGGIVVEGILNPQNYPLNPNDVGWTGLSGLSQGGQPSFSQIAAGGSVVWSTGASAVTTTATSAPVVSTQLNSGDNFTNNNSNFIWISANDYRTTFNTTDLSLVTGRTITGSGIRAGTTITGGFINTSGNYGYFNISQTTSGPINANTVNAFTVTATNSLTNRNFVWLSKSSLDASGARVGTTASSGNTIAFPANTTVNSIVLRNFAGTEYYEVQFTASYTGTFATATGTVTFSFVQPPYAQPGETVFSFIANPGERSTLDLAQLKELTNTPLGGRGTFPNGPDVLAINVYKVSGDAVVSNIIIRWGEAQA